MCLAIPGVVTEMTDDGMGTVDIMGITRNASFELTPSAKVGDYVLVHAGFSIEILDAAFAQDTLDLVREFPELISEEYAEARKTEEAGKKIQAERDN